MCYNKFIVNVDFKMNKNFQIILEKNKDFIESIIILLEKSILKDSFFRDCYKEADIFKKKLVEGKLMKFFSSVNLENIDKSSIYLVDKQGTSWTFAFKPESVELVRVRRSYQKEDSHNEKFFVYHNKEKSFIEESVWSKAAIPFKLDFFGTGLSQEDIDLTKIQLDFDLSFLSKMSLEDFHLNRKNKTVFKQNYDKNFGDKSFLLRKKGKKI